MTMFSESAVFHFGANRAGAQFNPVKGSLGWYLLALTVGSKDEDKVPVDLTKSKAGPRFL